jgi:hypothetical protein
MAELLYGSYGNRYFTEYLLMFIFDPNNRSDGRFRHSYIKNFYEDAAFGDNPVTHRRMEGNVEPSIIESEVPLPWEPDHHEAYQFREYFNVLQSQMGLNSCSCYFSQTAKRGRWGSWYWSIDQRGYRVYAASDGIYYQYGTYSAGGGEAESRVDSAELGFVFIENWSNPQLLMGWNGQVYSWPLYGFPSRITCSYEVHDPVPYYWMQHMETRYPSAGDSEALSECIRNAIADVSHLQMNNYANIGQVVSAFQSFRNFKVTELFRQGQDAWKAIKSVTGSNLKGLSKKQLRTTLYEIGKSGSKKAAKVASDAWLKYRYAYQTTKSDIEQYVTKVVESEKSIYADITPDQVIRGSIRVEGGTCNVKMRLHPNPFAGFDRMLINADRVGLLPGLYNLWDMIPFSFVADWFSGLGDLFEDMDQSLYLRYYKVDELLIGIKKAFALNELWGPTQYLYYDRSLLYEFPQWEAYTESSTSGRVIRMRAADLGSLIIGAVH